MAAVIPIHTSTSFLSARLRGLGVERFHRAAEVIYRQGDPSNGLVVIRTGLVRVDHQDSNDQDGGDSFWHLAGPDDILGFMDVYLNGTRRDTVTAAFDTIAVHISAELFHQCCRSDAAVRTAVTDEAQCHLAFTDATCAKAS